MKSIRICLLVSVFGIMISLFSCSKSDKGPSATVSFATSQVTYGEDAGAINVNVNLSAKQASDVVVTYSWKSADTTTYLGGDFTFGTAVASQVTIPAGQTAAAFVVNIIDDTQIDGNDDVLVTLASATGAAISTTGSTFDLTITDNDVAPANAMQVDLTWFTTGQPLIDINAVDLNLYLNYSVKYTTTAITDNGTIYKSSENISGFETLQVTATDPDSVYWAIANYAKGSNSTTLIMDFVGFGNGGFTDGTYIDGKAAGLGQANFIGPFLKAGTTFTYDGRTLIPARADGKIFSFMVDNFKPHSK